MFRALCRVQGEGAQQGPEAALAGLLRALEPEDAAVDDRFPDFSQDPADPPAHDLDAPMPASGGTGREAILQALVRSLGAYQGLLERYNRDFDDVFEQRARGETETDDETILRLRAVQTVLVKYPIAGQSAFAALVREGRRFATTAEGAAWKRRLAGSPLLARARTLFEGLAGGLLSEEGGAVPSVYVHAFVRALDRELEDVLSEVRGAGSQHERPGPDARLRGERQLPVRRSRAARREHGARAHGRTSGAPRARGGARGR